MGKHAMPYSPVDDLMFLVLGAVHDANRNREQNHGDIRMIDKVNKRTTALLAWMYSKDENLFFGYPAPDYIEELVKENING